MKQTCKIGTLMLGAFICLFGMEARGREFTDVQGRKLEGELVSVAGAQATIRRGADAKVFTVMISQFSPEDQKFMTDFGASLAHYVFDVKLVKDRKGTTKNKQNNVTFSAEQWVYKVALTNKSTADADDLTVDYWLFLKADDGKIKAGPRVQQTGTSKIGALKRSGVFQFETKPVMLSKQQLDGGFYYEDGTKNKARDTLGGVAMRFFQGGKEVYAWATEPDLLKSASGRAGPSVESDTAQ